jgi:hypothetical protein
MPAKTPPTYQLKVALLGVKPPIWRRILVPADLSLGRLHGVLQVAMGWTDSHLHQFIADNTFYGTPNEDFGFDEVRDENRYRLNQLLQSEKDWVKYEYDFGDSWEHRITLEKILPAEDKGLLPRCIKGKRACPPEDCGGIWGYQNLLEILADPKHDEHEDMLEWLGGEFDPEEFDLDVTNAMLAQFAR